MKKLLVIGALLCASPAWADEPVGCDKFKWPVDAERVLLNRADIATLDSGAELASPFPAAVTLRLHAPAEAKLPSPPERAPKPDTFAGFVTIKNLSASGVYTISLSAGGWVDVLQNGSFLKPLAFSGATGCEGLRKTMKFDLAPGPVTIQLSGIAADTIKLAVAPSTK